MITAILLIISNIFMTLAWYGHLKVKQAPLWIAIVASWALAFFEYLFQVPANRIGSARFSLVQLKVMQECIHHCRVRGDRVGIVPANTALEQHRLVRAHRRGRLLHVQLQQMKAVPAVRSLHALDALNFFLADVREGIGPFLAVYLATTLHWNPAQIGLAIALSGIAGVLAQTPMGALADHVRQKRLLIVIASAVIALGSLATVLIGTKTAIFSAQIAMQIAAAVYPPTVAAITLGLVGYRHMDRRTGRNGTFDHAGNVAGALFAGWLGSALGPNAIFFFAVVMSIVNSFAVLAIRERDIDHELARGAVNGNAAHVVRVSELLRNRNLAVFAVAVVLFHFANAAMLPLVGQFLAAGKTRGATLDMAACIIVAQLVMTPVALLAGKFAHTWGRKPIFLIGFLALPIRGALYTLSRDPRYLLAVQALDGIGAGIFGVVSVIVIADLTRGTGRFNLAQGAIATATGIGAAMSNAVTGVVAKNFGYNAGFLFLAAIAIVGLVFFGLAMPETKATPVLSFKFEALSVDMRASREVNSVT